MRHLRWVAGILLVLGNFALAGDAPWIRIKSEHFSVVTDAGERRGREVALHFEQMRGVFGTLMVKAKVNSPVPLLIVAFRNTKEMRQCAPLWHGKPTQVGGLFVWGEDQTFIMLDLSLDNPWQVVFHEYAHQLMNGNLPTAAAPWFEEGFAEYFSSIELDSRQAKVGKIPDEEYQVLDHAGWFKVSDLFRVQQNSSTYNENGDHRDSFYAESGMVVHYLYDNQLFPKLSTYFDLVNNQKLTVDDAIQRAFGVTAVQFDKQIRAYESSGRFKYYPIPTPLNLDSKNFTATPLTALDAQAIVADIHFHILDYRDKAADEFQAVLKVDPDNLTALRGMGYSYLVKQDYHNAGDFFSRAAEKSPNDPRVLYYSALLAQREGGLDPADPRTAHVQEQLEKAVQLDPEYADAFSMLAFVYSAQDKRELALKTMMKAVELNPRNPDYLFHLSQLCLMNRDFKDALSILHQMEKNEDPAVALRAQQQIPEVENAMTVEANGGKVEVHSSEGALHRRSAPEPPAEPAPVQVAAPAPTNFIKGKLTAIDCQDSPGATMTVVSGKATWSMHTANRDEMILIGADKFSCDWKNQSVAVNYRVSGSGSGEVISLELQ